MLTATRTRDDEVLSSSTYEYDGGGRTTTATRTGPGASAANYTYTPAGRLSGASWSTGTNATYSYGTTGQVAQVSPDGIPGLSAIDYSYDAAGHLTSIARGGSVPVTTTATYDPAGQLAALTHSAAGTDLAGYTLERDQRGNPTQVTADIDGAQTQTLYGYDTVGRLTSECRPTPGAPCTTETPGDTYTYDRAGNRTTQTTTSPNGAGVQTTRTVSTYDAGDQLITQTVNDNPPLTNTWTPDGALATVTDADGRVITQSTTDLAGELVATTLESGTQIGYTHDASGNRTSRTVDGALEATWSWDNSTGLPVRISQNDATGTPTDTWLTDPTSSTGTPLAALADETSDWLLTDPFGSITTAITPGTTTLTGTQPMNAFGTQLTAPTGTLAAQPIGFAGQYRDELTDLYDMRARDYNPHAGRFTTPDPIAIPTGMSLVTGYNYAFNNPLLLNDVTGNWPTWIEDVAAGVRGVGQGVGDIATGVGKFLWIGTNQEANDALRANLDQAYIDGGAWLVVNQFNPVYSLLENSTTGWELAQNGCVSESARAFTHATFDAASLAAVAGGAASSAKSLTSAAESGGSVAGRDALGHFTGAGGYGARAEAIGLSAYELATGQTVIRSQVRATLTRGGPGRYYDGLVRNADGTYIGIEVKSGSASLSASQRVFDSAVNEGAVARATLDGQPITITSTDLVHVP